ncbi:hypothetical protein L210DRAFT_2432345 [Boletus edulis BED1]|uniref:Uncharacterized protein n=1 Tax=Boletus edulis BED1 TaxID=1328754 RepID=A0AAD4BQ79_BOLED|nr:hypothetical protein L210DRAFT_2432345 [Boletus edulis BED1]
MAESLNDESIFYKKAANVDETVRSAMWFRSCHRGQESVETRSSPCSRYAPTCAASTDYRRALGTLGATPSIGSGGTSTPLPATTVLPGPLNTSGSNPSSSCTASVEASEPDGAVVALLRQPCRPLQSPHYLSDLVETASAANIRYTTTSTPHPLTFTTITSPFPTSRQPAHAFSPARPLRARRQVAGGGGNAVFPLWS